ncbi:MAG: PAS domain S-box protein [Thermoanaerobaculia bacterium]|jgi:PAS domain S-box-containing protein
MATSESFATRLLSTENRSVLLTGFATLVVALAVSLFAFFGAIVPAEKRVAVERWRRDLDAAVSVREVALDNWISDREASARVVAKFPSVQAVLQGGPESGAPGQLAEILSDLATETSLDAILVTDVSGKLRVASERGMPFADACADLATDTVARRRSHVVMRSVAGTSRIIVTAPVAERERPDSMLGAVILVIDPERWVYPLVSIRQDRHGSVEAVLVDRQGDSVRFGSPLLHRPDPPLTFSLPLRTRGLDAASAIDGTRRFSMATDYSGTVVFAATRRLTNAPWGLVVKVNATDVFAEAVTRARPIGIGMLLASLLLALVAALIARMQGREAREVARRSIERTALLLDATNDGVIFVSADGTILEVNRAAERMYQRGREWLKGTSVAELRVESERARVPGDLARAREAGRLVFRVTQIRSDGSPFPVEISSRVAELDGRTGFVSVVRDLSERIAAETRIETLNRILRTLILADDVIIRSTSREMLLQGVCDVIAREAPVPLAWIGTAETDGSIRVVATSGDAQSCLEGTPVRWDDAPEGKGPTGTALREQRTVSLPALDPAELAPWRGRALAEGLQSGISSPISPSGRRDSVLSLYSRDAEFFTEEIRALVGALTADIAFALDAMERRDAQREAEDLVRAIVARAPASIHAVDREGCVTLWNPASERLFGWSESEVVGSRLPIVGDAHEEEFRARLKRAMMGDPPPVGVVRRVRKDGTAIDLLMSVEVLHDKAGAVNGALAVAVDVTESLEHEQRARALFDAGVIGCLFGDIHGRVLDANDTFLEIVRYSREELRAGEVRWDAITPPEWRSLDAEGIAEAQSFGRCTPYEKEYVRKDGTRVRVLIGYKLLEPERERSVAFILDVSELRRERMARREAESVLGAIFETPGMPIAILEVKDNDLLHVDCNLAYAEGVGAQVAQVKGRLMGELGIARERIDEAIARARSLAVSGEADIYETERPRDGRRFLVSMILLPGGVPERVRVLIVMSDITLLLVAKDELRTLNTELETRVVARTGELLAANRELEAFTYSVSHDLRAPLRAIDGFSEILRREHGDRLDEEGQRLLRIIVSAARNMGQLIDDLLAFSRTGRLTLRRERVPMKALAQAAWDDIPADSRRDVSFELAPITDAEGDAALLRQVWHNLLENAVKYSGPRPDRRVEVGVELVDGRTAWFVRDNGVGFDMKYAETVFGVFQRLHAGNEFEGTGVGLAIVQRVVDRHGGKVWCHAVPGVGATFYFTLGE